MFVSCLFMTNCTRSSGYVRGVSVPQLTVLKLRNLTAFVSLKLVCKKKRSLYFFHFYLDTHHWLGTKSSWASVWEPSFLTLGLKRCCSADSHMKRIEGDCEPCDYLLSFLKKEEKKGETIAPSLNHLLKTLNNLYSTCLKM